MEQRTARDGSGFDGDLPRELSASSAAECDGALRSHAPFPGGHAPEELRFLSVGEGVRVSVVATLGELELGGEGWLPPVFRVPEAEADEHPFGQSRRLSGMFGTSQPLQLLHRGVDNQAVGRLGHQQRLAGEGVHRQLGQEFWGQLVKLFGPALVFLPEAFTGDGHLGAAIEGDSLNLRDHHPGTGDISEHHERHRCSGDLEVRLERLFKGFCGG